MSELKKLATIQGFKGFSWPWPAEINKQKGRTKCGTHTNQEEFFCCANYLPLSVWWWFYAFPWTCHKLCDQVIKLAARKRRNASEGRKAGYCLWWIYSGIWIECRELAHYNVLWMGRGGNAKYVPNPGNMRFSSSLHKQYSKCTRYANIAHYYSCAAAATLLYFECVDNLLLLFPHPPFDPLPQFRLHLLVEHETDCWDCCRSQQ